MSRTRAVLLTLAAFAFVWMVAGAQRLVMAPPAAGMCVSRCSCSVPPR